MFNWFFATYKNNIDSVLHKKGFPLSAAFYKTVSSGSMFMKKLTTQVCEISCENTVQFLAPKKTVGRKVNVLWVDFLQVTCRTLTR